MKTKHSNLSILKTLAMILTVIIPILIILGNIPKLQSYEKIIISVLIYNYFFIQFLSTPDSKIGTLEEEAFRTKFSIMFLIAFWIWFLVFLLGRYNDYILFWIFGIILGVLSLLSSFGLWVILPAFVVGIILFLTQFITNNATIRMWIGICLIFILSIVELVFAFDNSGNSAGLTTSLIINYLMGLIPFLFLVFITQNKVNSSANSIKINQIYNTALVLFAILAMVINYIFLDLYA